MLLAALQAQKIPTPTIADEDEDVAGGIRIPLHHKDTTGCPISGEIRVMRYNRQGVWVVKFIKSKGDPLQFRRFFKVLGYRYDI
jgi:hypothetical protein